MINNDKWIQSIQNAKIKNDEELFQIDHSKWTNTIPKKNNFNSSITKYSFTIIIFIFGLFLVSFVKNETRNLEKEISYLNASINSIEFNLKQAILDNEVITSPENISKLAKEYLGNDLIYYKKSQIKNLNEENKISKKFVKKNNLKILNNLPENVKEQVAKKIKKKKKELAKLQELYNDPKSIPDEVKIKVSNQIERKKFELKSLYETPGEMITIKRLGKWGAVQVVKVALGMPVIPGR